MQQSTLSSIDLRAFLRTCHCFLQDEMTLDSWTAFQKLLLISERSEFGIFIRQLKKLPQEVQLEIVDGFSNGQIESKLWLLETLGHVLPDSAFQVKVLGSWFGLLPRLFTWFFQERILALRAYDIDPRWEPVARSLNEPESHSNISWFFTKDMNHINYQFVGDDTIIVNTACEHLKDFNTWFESLTPGNIVVLQGNNFSEVEDHHTVWRSLDDFKKSAPLKETLFEGQLELPKYNRYMLIGIKG